MTTHTRTLISLEDILAFEFECNNPSCFAKITVPVGSDKHLPASCPQCKDAWFNAPAAKTWHALEALKQSLADALENQDKAGCKLTIELRSSDI